MTFAGVGVLDVVVDGKTIFSHQAEQRMLDWGEIVRLIQALQSEPVQETNVLP